MTKMPVALATTEVLTARPTPGAPPWTTLGTTEGESADFPGADSSAADSPLFVPIGAPDLSPGPWPLNLTESRCDPQLSPLSTGSSTIAIK